MFDSNKPFEVIVPTGSDPSGKKTCLVRFPTDAEWCERARKTVIVRKQLSADASTSEMPDDDRLSAELFAKIRTDDGRPEMDAAEGAYVIQRLENCRVLSCEREGIQFRITMKVPGGEVIHTLRMPKLADEREFSRMSAPPPIQRRHHSEIRIYLEPSGELWGKCHISTSGYADGSAVPIIHKSQAISEMLRAISQDGEEKDPEQ